MRAIIVAAVLALPLAQATTPYAGTWTAAQSGRTFIRLELSTAGNSVGGRIGLGDIELDKTGAVKTVSEAPALTPIEDVKVTGSIVTFSHKDGRDVDRFRLSVLENGTAELTMLLNAADKRELATSGITEFKPITLTKKQ